MIFISVDFPGAVLPDDPEDLSVGDREADARQGAYASEMLGYCLQAEAFCLRHLVFPQGQWDLHTLVPAAGPLQIWFQVKIPAVTTLPSVDWLT